MLADASSAADITIINASFISPCSIILYMSQAIQEMFTIKGPRTGIDLGTSSPPCEHAKPSTTGDIIHSSFHCASVYYPWFEDTE